MENDGEPRARDCGDYLDDIGLGQGSGCVKGVFDVATTSASRTLATRGVARTGAPMSNPGACPGHERGFLAGLPTPMTEPWEGEVFLRPWREHDLRALALRAPMAAAAAIGLGARSPLLDVNRHPVWPGRVLQQAQIEPFDPL
jgi:hypothetical protein